MKTYRSNFKTRLGAILTALALQWCFSSSMTSAEEVKVDCGLAGQVVQAGFDGWTSTGTDNTGLTKTFTAFGGTLTAKALRADGTDGVQARQRNTTTAGPLGQLLQDAFKNPSSAGGGLRLVFQTLPAGAYKITTYHHDSTGVHGTIDVFLTDANGNDQLVADEVRISTGTSPAPTPATATFLLRSDGSTDVYMRMVVGNDANNPEVWLNGFVLETYTGDDVVTITQQPRNAAVALGNTATFSVVAKSFMGQPLGYQWQKGTENIADATSASYTTPATVQDDNGTAYRVVISHPTLPPITSSAGTLRIIGTAGLALPDVASGTLLVHLTADTGVTDDVSGVSKWTDQSANAFEFAPINANKPVLETGLTGNKVVRFNANTLLKSSVPMQLFTDPDSGLTIFTAFTANNSAAQGFVVNWGIRDADLNRGSLEMGYDTGNGAGVGNFGIHRGCGEAALAPQNTIVNNQFAIMGTFIKSVGAPPANVAMYKNGVSQTVVNDGAANGGGCSPGATAYGDHAGWLAPGEYLTGLSGLDIGGRDDTGLGSFGAFHNGNIGEVLVYRGTLTRADRLAIEAYLGEKFGIATAPVLVITKQPANAALVVGETATFTVVADLSESTEGLTYQWQKGGIDLVGETGTSYTTPPTVAGDNGTKYRVIVRSTDGQSVTSTEVNLRIVGPAGLTLPTVASGTLLVRLTADAGVIGDASGVATWTDQSLNAFVFAPTLINANKPTLEIGLTGNKVLRFNGNVLLKSSVPMQLFPTTSSGLTIFTAFSAVNNDGQKFVVNWGIIDANNIRGSLELGYDTGNGSGVGNFGIHYGCGQGSTAPANTILNNQFAVLSTLIKSAGAPPANVVVFKNGISQEPMAAGAAAGCLPNHAGWLAPGEYSTGLAALDIGARDDSGAGNFGSYHNGDIGEILVYQGTLSDADRAAVEKYLGERYGVATTPPTSTYNAAANFIPGPAAQSPTAVWQYFEASADRTTMTLMQEWRTSGNDVLTTFPQWDNLKANGQYPFVQKTAPGGPWPANYGGLPFPGDALFIHPAPCPVSNPCNNASGAAVGWYNSTDKPVSVSYTVGWNLLQIADGYNDTGVNYYVQRQTVGNARFLALGAGFLERGADTATQTVGDIEVGPGELLYFGLDNRGTYFWDHTQLSLDIAATTKDTVPFITQQPQSVLVIPGATVTLSVAAGSVQPLTYQWLKNDEIIANATASTLVLPTVTTQDDANYKVVVSNVQGSTTSAAAKVTVAVNPTLALDLYPGMWLTGTLGLHYRVEYAEALAPTTWILLQDIPSLPSSPYFVLDPTATSATSQRFYQAVAVP